jgi:hypothetical protein
MTLEQEGFAQWLRVPAERIIRNWLDPECMKWAETRLEESFKEDSPTHSSDAFCPTRLIDIQSQPAKLVTLTNVAKTPKYAALSYCWGTEDATRQQLKTTEDNISSMESGISEQEMTAVLRDAVSVAKSLSIPYLWIDALCILQGPGGTEDWQRQSAIMHKIYGNAYVTVIALSSSSFTEGFCGLNQSEVFIDCGPKFPNPGHSAPTPSPTLRIGYLLCQGGGMVRTRVTRDFSLFMGSYERSHWQTRGWTFQEDYMTTRSLAFGKANLHFQGVSKRQSYGDPRSYEGPYSYRFSTQLTRSEETTSPAHWWDRIVGPYSGRLGFTRASDVFPAISGLAALFCETHGFQPQEYVAGHWKADLFRSVVWDGGGSFKPTLDDALRDLETPEEYIRPSWSWALHGRVAPINPDFADTAPRAECQILARTTCTGNNPFGRISDGVLQITGRVAPLPSDLKIVSGGGYARNFAPWVCAGDERHIWHCRLDWSPVTDEESRGELRMIITGSIPEAKRGFRPRFGLLIHPAGPSHPGKFVRVGVFQSAEATQPEGSLEKALETFSTQTIEIV